MSDIQAGSRVSIVSDIVIDGVLTFAGGEQVTVEYVSPNSADPRYRFVVFSVRTGNRYQLRDEDLAELPAGPIPVAPPPQTVQAGAAAPVPAPPGAAGGPAPRPSRAEARAKTGRPPKAEKAKAGGGLKALTVILVILLVAALGGAGYLYYKWDDTKKKDQLRIEKQQQEIETWKQKYRLALESSAPTSTQPEPSTNDQQALAALAGSQYPGRVVGQIKVVGDWARVSLAGTSNPPVEGEQVYYRKVNGAWTYVAAGTGLTQADIPEAPPELFQ
ncbi:MAG: hypothetical protein KKF41_01185 [Actinobacteria bacterium]|nr:hypothetical protein [Actinomycetota bacterium]MBU1943678.1 hypothetical protein [Actinomycetota bacterium]MBU2686178.1 hypothetical protein [Actinomycetota bacterium]